MSGGSFEYLFVQAPEDMRQDLLEAMAEALVEYEGHAQAWMNTVLVAELRRKFVETADALLDDGLADVWKAVEWQHSHDGFTGQVEKALREYNARQKITYLNGM